MGMSIRISSTEETVEKICLAFTWWWPGTVISSFYINIHDWQLKCPALIPLLAESAYYSLGTAFLIDKKTTRYSSIVGNKLYQEARAGSGKKIVLDVPLDRALSSLYNT